MYYLAVHDIELMCAYAGGKARKVYAQFPNKICRAFGDDDGVYAIITFDNGVVGCLEIDWSYQESMPMPVWSYAKVSGTKGTGVVEAGPQGLTLCTDEQFAYPDTMLAPTFNGQMQGDMVLQIDHFAQCILHDRPFAVQLDTPIDAVRIIEACFASGQTGQAVEIGS